MTLLEAALTYASWGWSVIPVVPGGKVPATQHGVRDATRDRSQIVSWWQQNPSYNIGIAAGAASGLIVFDIDPRNGGEESWRNWIAENGTPEDGAMQLTAGGGQHYLAEYDPEIRSCKLADGVDLLSDGRYFVASPSQIDGRTYEWEASSDPFDDAAPIQIPTAWKAAYTARRKPVAPQEAGALIQGNRNNGLTALAGAMRHYGMTEAEILAALSIANETRCDIPLPSSEIAQIARSVARYAPEVDVASSTAKGSEAAEALIAAAQAESQDYHFTRATSFVDQPAPLQWVVRNWIPDAAVSMIYGESGAGKTFISLDIACHIAAGLPWQDQRTKSGVVVYMAGEGNYGLRQRVAAWCRFHQIDRLDNLLISNKAIDLDSPSVSAQILNAVRERVDGDVAMIFVDTLNNHMSGDENSARDTRNLFNSVSIVSRALNAAACIVHHTGHGEDTKHRARGSSALKASLDSSILVQRNDDNTICISCTKMKDAEVPNPIYGGLERVPLGWVDDNGEEIIGAVFKWDADYAKPEPKKSKGIQQDITILRNIWDETGELVEGKPFISRSAAIDYLMEKMELKQSTAEIYVKPAAKGRLINNLLLQTIIEPRDKGWIVIDKAICSGWILGKGSGT